MPCGEPVEPAVVLKVAVACPELVEGWNVTVPGPLTLDQVVVRVEP